MTTDKIIRDEYVKHYGECPSATASLPAPVFDWRDGLQDFMFAWKACEQWHERQRMMDKDYQEQVQEEARLARGE